MEDNSLEMRVWLVHLKDNTSTHNTFFIKASKMSVCDNDPYYWWYSWPLNNVKIRSTRSAYPPKVCSCFISSTSIATCDFFIFLDRTNNRFFFLMLTFSWNSDFLFYFDFFWEFWLFLRILTFFLVFLFFQNSDFLQKNLDFFLEFWLFLKILTFSFGIPTS